MRILQVGVAAISALLLGLSGCTSGPSKDVVDFGGVSDAQRGANFDLRIRVVGVGNESKPIAGAFVGVAVAVGSQALAKAHTGPDGEAVVHLRKDQRIRVVAQASGWTTEDSGIITIGDAKDKTTTCGSFLLESWCVVTESNQSSEYKLGGDSGQVSVVLFQNVVTQTFDVSVGPHVNAFVTVAPDGKKWVPQAKKMTPVQGLHSLYMIRLVNSHTTLTWQNSMLDQADFEVGVGCSSANPSASTSQTAPRAAPTSGGSVQIDWKPKRATWSECSDFYAGPVKDSFSTNMVTHVKAELTFEGRSSIVIAAT